MAGKKTKVKKMQIHLNAAFLDMDGLDYGAVDRVGGDFEWTPNDCRAYTREEIHEIWVAMGELK